MTRPLRILFLMEDLCFGGTQRQMLELLVRLDRTQFLPSVCTLTGPTDLDHIVHEAGIQLLHMNGTRRVHPLFFLKLGLFLYKVRPDVILPCTALPNIWGRIWGKFLHIPVIGTCRGGGGPKRQYERWLWRFARFLVCNSLALRQRLLEIGVPDQQLVCIQNGVDTLRFAPGLPGVAQRPPIILCVARLAQDKEHLTLFRAFSTVLRSYPDAQLHIVGDGPEETNLKAWVNSHNLANNILFFPGTTDVRPYYAKAKLFALTSAREGQPNVILEAMSCGLPVCATAVGGIPALVEHGKTGLLSPRGDSSAFAENCMSLLADSNLAEEMGNRARTAISQKFAYDTMVHAHEDLFRQIAQHRE